MNVIFIKKKRFNLKLPSVFDATLAPGNVAIYDGDVNLSAASWQDRAGGNQITFFNAPTYNAAGLNGHGTIRFDGINQYGESVVPVLNDPLTFYLVLKQVSWTALEAIFDSDTDGRLFYQINTSPNLRITDGTDALNTDPDLAVGSWGIFTLVFNGLNSSVRTNLNNAILGEINSTGNGIKLANDGSIRYGNIEFSYIIMRNVADPTWLQNNFINWLKNRFAI